MLPFQIKVCGISKPEDAVCACEAGADAIGLNFYEKSVRFVSNEAAKKVADAVREFSANSGKSAKTVGVFVNRDPNDIVEIQQAVGLDGIQLHGNEQPGFFQQLTDSFGERWRNLDLDSRLLFVRAVRPKLMTSTETTTSTGTATEGVGDAAPKPSAQQSRDILDVALRVKQWTASGSVSILIDAHVPGEFGGTGKQVDWGSIPDLARASGVEIVLAGGLNSWNVGEAIAASKVKAVDVASGVESEPGIKDKDQIRKFVANALKAFNQSNQVS